MTRKKGTYKIKAGFSIDSKSNEDLEQYCKENLVNKSKLVNKLIKDFLKEKEILCQDK